MNAEPLVVERLLNAPIGKVWEAITDKDKMKEWYFDMPEFRPEVGCQVRMVSGPPKGKSYMHLFVVTEVVPGSKITYSWAYEGYEGMSYVTFELFAEGGKTKIVLTHRGLETFPANNPDLAKHNFAAGWDQIINTSLPAYVEKEA